MAYVAAKDYPKGQHDRASSPSRRVFAIEPDAADMALYAKAVYINTDGTVTGVPVDNIEDDEFNFVVTAGQTLAVAFRRITAAPDGSIGLR